MKKIIAITLALIMSFSYFSLVSFAEETENIEHLTEVPEGYVGIYTKNDLNNIRNNLKGNYILMNDIVFDDSDFEENGNYYNDGMGWVPIGGVFDKWSAYYYKFTGVFDGNGYSIINIKMDRKPTSYSAYPSETVTRPDGSTLTTYSTHAFGLFVENSGIIEDLNVSIEYKIEANPYAVSGSICGINSGLISNCKTYGTIFAEKTSNSGDSCFGGIAGLIDNGKITLCANNVDISGKNPYSFPYINCGGIVGGSNGKGKNVISYCYNNGNITPETVSDGYLAGIAARASGFGTYYNGYSFVIENCYNTGTIGNENIYGKVAGICGEGYHKETKLINCYNVGSIKSSNKSAGIIIEYNRSTNCYYLNSSADCLWYSYGTNYIINDLYDSQMKTEEAFNGFDFNNVWIVDASSEYPYPQLRNNLQSEKIPVEHDYSEIILVDATCTKLGLKKLFCSKCGFAFDVVIDKSATHIYKSEVTTEPTHLAEGVKTYICACGDTYTEAIEKLTVHTYETVVTEPTCTTTGYTTYTCECGDSYVDDYTDKLEHVYASEITTPATHLTEGIETFTCECGDSYRKPVAKLKGHTYTSEVTKEPTHLEEGEMTFTCECGDSYTEVIEKIAKHNYKEDVTEPTCTAKGYTTYTCECGDIYVADYTESKGHIYSVTTTQPTCIQNGLVTTFCTSCGDTHTETLEPTGHSFAEGSSKCENCDFDKADDCSCNCHKGGISGLIFKIILFFQRIFKTNKTCACGVSHY